MNIKGFKDINKNNDDSNKKDKKDKKIVDSYIGGSSSGLNVENPDDKIDLTVYKNGFKINNEEFRDISNPENKTFMDEVNQNYIPQELVKRGYTKLGIALTDKKEEIYVPPVEEKKFKAFTGTGKNLNDTHSNVNVSHGEMNTNVNVTIDNSQPVTKINFRIHNGQVISQTFNTSHTLRDIRIFLSNFTQVYGTFDILEGFPPRPLTDEAKSIKELKLEGTTLIQKITS